MSSKSRRIFVKSGIKIILISCILIALDQITKYLAAHHLKGYDSIVLIPNVFELTYLENPWAAFSLGKQLNSAFLIVVLILTVLFCIVLLAAAFRIPPEKHYGWVELVLILFLSGAIGNLIDRVARQYVIDFFSFVLIHFPIFNVADIYVVTGAVVFVWTILFRGNLYEEIFPSKRRPSLNSGNTGDKENE